MKHCYFETPKYTVKFVSDGNIQIEFPATATATARFPYSFFFAIATGILFLIGLGTGVIVIVWQERKKEALRQRGMRYKAIIHIRNSFKLL